jgi:hypothetical protein
VASLDPSKCSVTHLDDVIWTVCTAAARSVTGLLNVTTTGCATPTTGRFSALIQAQFSTDRSYDGLHVTDCRLPKSGGRAIH